jgi:hypothetical protein
MPAHRKPLDEPYYGHHPRGAHNKTKPDPIQAKRPSWRNMPEPDKHLLTLVYADEKDRDEMDEWLKRYFDDDRRARKECICLEENEDW